MSLNPRKISARILYNVLKNKSNLSHELSQIRSSSELDLTDKRFISELATGCIRNLEYLDYAISCASDVKVSKIAPYVMCVLRIGAYQILFLDKIPHSAAVNESVKIIKKSSNHRLSGFVNAVLRKIIANGRNLKMPEDEFEASCIMYSCPTWIAKLWKDSLGDEYKSVLSAMNTKPDTILRVNTLKTDADELVSILRLEGWICDKYKSKLFPEIDYLVSASKIIDLQASKAYKDGLFYVQDCAGSYVGEILNPTADSVVFDMCASPGGKTTHLGEKIKNRGTIYAFDVSQAKIDTINENAQRLGIDTINTAVLDSSIAQEKYFDKADYLLVDAPCSGLGIIRKKPDIKYLRNPEDSRQLAQISIEILNASSNYLKSGGTMVFSTCTTAYEENEAVLFEFLKRHPDFHLKKINCTKDNKGYMTLYPHIDDCDGFFISLMTRE